MIKWILLILLLIVIFRIFINFKNVRSLRNPGSYIVAGVPGSGKSAFVTCLASSYKKGRVVSVLPIRNAYACSYDCFLNFKKYKSPYAFIENDLIVVDELNLVINSNDLEKKYKDNQEGFGLFCKLIRHNINGRMYIVEQSPNRIPIQVREKVEYFIQMKNVKFLLFLVRFKINVYTDLEDWNKDIISGFFKKRKAVKLGQTINYKSSCFTKVIYFRKSRTKNYDTRSLSVISDVKTELSDIKEFKLHNELNVTSDNIEGMGLNKLADINKFEKDSD